LTVVHHAAVFCRDRLDIGTRFFLRHLPRISAGADIVDLGCGNGIVGLMAKRLNPLARLLFCDESFMALASAETNWRLHDGDSAARFVADDCLAGQAADSADLVLVNPPFHQQQAITTAVARRMFRDVRRVLRPGGELRVIGNRHLEQHLFRGDIYLLQQLINRFVRLCATDKYQGIVRLINHHSQF
jgi:16S rRNA (guanine1207-N2)-methyltransferase